MAKSMPPVLKAQHMRVFLSFSHDAVGVASASSLQLAGSRGVRVSLGKLVGHTMHPFRAVELLQLINSALSQLIETSLVQNFTEMLANSEGLMWPDTHVEMSNSGSCSNVVSHRQQRLQLFGCKQ